MSPTCRVLPRVSKSARRTPTNAVKPAVSRQHNRAPLPCWIIEGTAIQTVFIRPREVDIDDVLHGPGMRRTEQWGNTGVR